MVVHGDQDPVETARFTMIPFQPNPLPTALNTDPFDEIRAGEHVAVCIEVIVNVPRRSRITVKWVVFSPSIDNINGFSPTSCKIQYDSILPVFLPPLCKYFLLNAG